MTRKLPKWWLILLVPCLLTGCGWILQSGPQKHFYLLQAQRHQQTHRESQDSTLRVEPFSISQAFQGQQLVLRTEQHEFVQDYQRRFLIPAQSMLTELTRNWLARSGLFTHVLPQAPGSVQADYQLQGRIEALYMDLSQKQPKTILEMEFLLLGWRDQGLQILGQKGMRQESKLQELSTSEAIQAWSKDLELILQELEIYLQRWLKPPTATISAD